MNDPRSQMTPAWRVPAFALLLAACGPPSASDGDDDGGTTTSPTTTATPSDTSGEDPSGQDSIGPETGGETGTETGGETDSTTGNPFLIEVDQLPDSCDPWAQDCPEGDKCVPTATEGASWDTNKCVPITGDQAPGEPCVYGGAAAATDDCGAGSMCWFVEELDGQLVGECVPFCTGTPDQPQCPEGSFCALSGSGVINVCLDYCDPLLQDCADGYGCTWAADQFSCVPLTEDIGPGQPCSFVDDCALGSMCISPDFVPGCAGDDGCCTPFCSLADGDPACAAVPGSSCVAFFLEGEAPAGYEEVGVCVLP